jgi:hypothetical protein
MDYDTNDFPIERDPYAPPDQHFTFADGVSRAAINGEKWKELGRENARRQLAAKHSRRSHTA